MRRLSSAITLSLAAAAFALSLMAYATTTAAAPASQMRLSADVVGLLSWVGGWSADTVYEAGEVVARDGSSYRAKTSTSTDPATSDDWELVAAKGDRGPQGPEGAQGKPGPATASHVVPFPMPALNAVKRNNTGLPILMTMRGGVVSDPGENGHLYLEIASEAAASTPGPWSKVSYVACRNRPENTGQIACGATLTALVPPKAYYRLTLVTAANYKTPDYVYDAPNGTFVALGV